MGRIQLPLSFATDENDGATVCKHYLSLQQIVGIPMGGGGGAVAPLATLVAAKAGAMGAKRTKAFSS